MIGILGLRGVSLGTIKWEWIGSPGFGANSAKGAALQCAVRSQGGHSHGFHFVLLISRLFFVCSFLFYSGKEKARSVIVLATMLQTAFLLPNTLFLSASLLERVFANVHDLALLLLRFVLRFCLVLHMPATLAYRGA